MRLVSPPGSDGRVTVDLAGLVRLAEQDPQSCLRVCREILAEPRSDGLDAHAHRALGIAYRELGEIEDSIRELELARDLYRHSGEDIHEAETVISLAWSLAISGGLVDGVDLLDPLLNHADASIRAHAQVQKAGLIARTGDLRGAMSLYAEAQQVLDELKDMRWLAILHSTRGLVETYLTEFEAAEEDLGDARDIYDELGQRAAAAEMTHNLGFVAVQRGDIARGLSLMLEAESLLQGSGLPIEAIASDRAYAYMLAGLPAEAYREASRLARRLGAKGQELDRAEALYLAARASLANGDAGTAVDVADEAARLAAEQGRTRWELMASLVREEACLRGGFPGDPSELVALAGALANQGTPVGETQALALAALRHLEAGDADAAHAVLTSLPSSDGEETELSVQLLVAVARARVALAQGDRQAAATVLAKAADLVDAQRSMLSATEARAGVSQLADEIAVLGLEAMHEIEPSMMAWTERFRGASLRVAPVVMSPDTDLAETLAELRPIVRDLMAPGMASEDTADLATEARRLEKRVHDLAMAREGDPGSRTSSDSVEDVTAALGARHMLYIYDIGAQTYGEMIGPSGMERVELGEPERLRFLAGHLLSALRRGFMRGRSSSVVHEMIAELAGLLLAPLAGSGTEDVVVPPPDLLGLPWTAMAKAIDPDLRMSVSPSAGLWARADGRSARRGRFGVVAGPRLEYAPMEAERVGGVYAGADLLAGGDATVEAVLRTMARCDRLHAVAHTRLRDDNPMFSALELADGFLNLYDLEGLESVPDTVVLSACDSAHDNVVGGHEMYGLTSVLLSRGTRSVIATVAPLPDSAESVETAVRIHTALNEGASASAAVRDAQSGFAAGVVDPSVAFVAYGA